MEKTPESLREAFNDGMADSLVENFNTLPRTEQKAILLKMAFVDQCHKKINEITQDEKLDIQEMSKRVLHHVDTLASLYASIDELCEIEKRKKGKNGK